MIATTVAAASGGVGSRLRCSPKSSSRARPGSLGVSPEADTILWEFHLVRSMDHNNAAKTRIYFKNTHFFLLLCYKYIEGDCLLNPY